MEPRIQYVTSSDGVRIAYASVGEGHPFVVAANVWGDIDLAFQPSGPIYGGLAGALVRNGFRFVVYDGRCCGSSERGVNDVSWAARLADLEAVVDRLELERFDLFTLIHGGTTAIGYAAKHPDRVTHLVLEAPYTRGADYYARSPLLRATKALVELAEDNWELFTLTLTNWLTHFRSQEAARLAETYRKSMEAADYRRLIAAFQETDVSDQLSLIEAPTLVIQDSTSPFSQTAGVDAPNFRNIDFVREVVAGIREAELASVRNREEMVEAIVRFLRDDTHTFEADHPDRSRAVRTVLFTDLVGHTKMMSRLGDERGREVLREHEQITREELKAHGGTEVKTMGDGFMASFGSVTKAVECAIALQKAIDERNRSAGAQHTGAPGGVAGKEHPAPTSEGFDSASSPPLHVRCGLNAGEPIEEEGDLFGATVILASRIAARAGGGEILVSDNVRSLSAGKGFLFSDRGEFVAKGFEEPVRVYEVNWRT